MAQHPEKLKWKDEHPYGLSASQFGMALGFCGRVSDYVNYLRHIVGTEREFKGNEFTAHGINTEPKSRALYEILTGCKVHDGGFFVTADRILGCSPDGQVYCSADERALEHHGQSSPSPSTFSSQASVSSSRHQSGGVLQGSLAVGTQHTSRGSSGGGDEGSRLSVRVPFRSGVLSRTPPSAHSLPASSSSPPTSGVQLKSELQGEATSEDLTSPFMKLQLSSSAKVEPSGHTAATTAPAAALATDKQKVRLLEIKSPFRALYDCSKQGYQPFGIPLHYMCQIQGQLAIADCEECDFFIYLDHPVCQVEAWRVRRCRPFWQWAEPNLRQVSNWVKDGPPDWLNRSFAFTPFDFGRIEVLPLVFPYDITAGQALQDARRFSFFARFPSPYAALERHREARRSATASLSRGSRESSSSGGGGGNAALAQLQHRALEWCQHYSGRSWSDLTPYEHMALTVQTPVVRYLFEDNDELTSAAATKAADCVDNPDDCTARSSDATAPKAGGHFAQTLSAWRRALEAENLYEGSATAALWRMLMRTASAGRDPLVRVAVSIPEDWEEGRFAVRCTLLHGASDAARNGNHRNKGGEQRGEEEASFVETVMLSFSQRRFLAALLAVPEVRKEDSPDAVAAAAAASAVVVGSDVAAAVPVPSQVRGATPLEHTPMFRSLRSQEMRGPTQLSPSSATDGAPKRRRLSAVSPTVAACAVEAASVSRSPSVITISSTPPSPLTEDRQRVVEVLSQQIRRCSTPPRPCGGNKDGFASAGKVESGIGVVSSELPAVQHPRDNMCCVIGLQQLYDLLRYAEDCEGVMILRDAAQPPLIFRCKSTRDHQKGKQQPSGFTLVVGEGTTLRHLLVNAHVAQDESVDRRVVAICRQVMRVALTSAPSSSLPISLVPCFIDSSRTEAAETKARRTPVPLPLQTPSFSVNTEQEASAVLDEVTALLERAGHRSLVF